MAVDAGVVPPIKGSWEAVEFELFVQYGPPTPTTCRLELAFLASARGAVDAVELPCDAKELRPRTAQRKVGWRHE
jgi:hypothetical protein